MELTKAAEKNINTRIKWLNKTFNDETVEYKAIKVEKGFAYTTNKHSMLCVRTDKEDQYVLDNLSDSEKKIFDETKLSERVYTDMLSSIRRKTIAIFEMDNQNLKIVANALKELSEVAMFYYDKNKKCLVFEPQLIEYNNYNYSNYTARFEIYGRFLSENKIPKTYFKTEYLKEAMAALKNNPNKVELSFTGKHSPFLLEEDYNGDIKYVVAPIRGY